MWEDDERDEIPSQQKRCEESREMDLVLARDTEQLCDQPDQEVVNQIDKSCIVEDDLEEVEEEEKVIEEQALDDISYQYDNRKLGMHELGLEIVNQYSDESCSWHRVSSRGNLDTSELE